MKLHITTGGKLFEVAPETLDIWNDKCETLPVGNDADDDGSEHGNDDAHFQVQN